jgi:uncharacterized membrane protein required for colicin V production
MSFTWLDGLLLLVGVALVIWELRRDLGQALFDTVALVVGLRLALWVGPGLAPHLGLANPNDARAIALLVVFAIGTTVGLVAGFYLNAVTRWTLDQFDRVAGLLLGFSGSVIVCHVLVAFFALLGTTKTGPPQYIAHSPLAQEALTFRTFHEVIQFFDGLRLWNS